MRLKSIERGRKSLNGLGEGHNMQKLKKGKEILKGHDLIISEALDI